MQRIELNSIDPDYVFTVDIDSKVYRIRLQWCDRTASWYGHIADDGDEPIVSGCRLSVNYPLFWRSRDTRMPKGIFLVISIIPGGSITRDNLGTEVNILYLTQAEYYSIIDDARISSTPTITATLRQ